MPVVEILERTAAKTFHGRRALLAQTPYRVNMSVPAAVVLDDLITTGHTMRLSLEALKAAGVAGASPTTGVENMGAIHTDARADQVLELVVAGLTRRDIIKWVETKSDWKIGTRQVDRLIARRHAVLEGGGGTPPATRACQGDPSAGYARCSLQINDFKGRRPSRRNALPSCG